MSSLALLEQMSSYSTEMVDAARANDWDRLTRLERQVASLRDRMGVEEALGFQGRASKRMSEDERQKKIALIRRISARLRDADSDLRDGRIDEVEYEAPLADGSGKTAKVKIVPLQFLKAVLPNPQDLGENYDGETSIGCRIRGVKDGKERTYYIYNNCDHEQAYRETGTQAVSFTTGVPAALGASMWAKGLWRGAGVFNVEEFDPDPFLAELGQQGLPWHELFDVDIEL